jgi:hypothetical protein
MSSETDTPDQAETPEEPGSAPIAPIKYEIFAQRVARGVSKADAYVGAGFTANAGNAHRLALKEKVAARIAWLLEQAAKAAVFDAGWIKSRMGQMADALTEIVVDPVTGVRKPGPMYNAHAGARVLELLGREQGIFKDKIELGGTVQVGNRRVFEQMTVAERAFMREMLAKAAARLPVPANDDAPVEEAPAEESGVVPSAK